MDTEWKWNFTLKMTEEEKVAYHDMLLTAGKILITELSSRERAPWFKEEMPVLSIVCGMFEAIRAKLSEMRAHSLVANAAMKEKDEQNVNSVIYIQHESRIIGATEALAIVDRVEVELLGNYGTLYGTLLHPLSIGKVHTLSPERCEKVAETVKAIRLKYLNELTTAALNCAIEI